MPTRLLRYRLRWYATGTARLLLRRWQGLLLLVGLVSATGATVVDNLATFALPLLGLLTEGHGAGWRFGYLVLVLTATTLWAALQRPQIEGGPFMAFVASLPVPARRRRGIDLVVLVLADSPLLMLVGAAMRVARMRPGAAAAFVLLADVALLALVAQLALLEGRRTAWIGVLAACALLAATFRTRMDLAAGLLVGGIALAALAAAPWPRMPARRARARARDPRRPHDHRPRAGTAVRLSLAVLLRERRGEALAKTAVAGGLAIAACGLMAAFDYDGRSFAVVLLAQGAMALAFSGLFRGLHMAHMAALAYCAALPLASNWRRRADAAAVLAFGLPFLAVPATAAWAVHAAAAPRIALGTLSFAALLCALRAAQLASERHAVVLGVVLAGGWTAATIACLN